MSFEDIAAETGWSYREVRSYYYSGIAKLGNALAEVGFTADDLPTASCRIRTSSQLLIDAYGEDEDDEPLAACGS